MAFADHIAILLQGSFDRPQKNKFKPNEDPEYYAVVAMEPSAANDLGSIMSSVSPGGSFAGLHHPVGENRTHTKPYPGIPDDWLVMRFSTKYTVPILDANGAEVVPTAENAAYIRSQLFAGQRVRINGKPEFWDFNGKRGIKFYLTGVMAVGGGDRRPSTSGIGAFDQYRPSEGQTQSSQLQSAAEPAAPASQPAAAAAPANANPFSQGTAAQASNPFGQR